MIDLSSGTLAFQNDCPGEVMKQLMHDQPDQVRSLKSFATHFAKGRDSWLCRTGAPDLSTVTDFIKAIDGLKKLRVLNHAQGDDAVRLQSAIMHHTKSLTDLAVHTPPQGKAEMWTPAFIQQLSVEGTLPQIKTLSVDISLDEAETRYKKITSCDATSPTPTAIDALAGLVARTPSLEKLILFVNLRDAGSSFANVHTWNAMGSLSFPKLDDEAGIKLARDTYDRIVGAAASSEGGDQAVEASSLKSMELHFARRCWDDRAQFWTLDWTIRVVPVEGSSSGEVKVETEPWKSYLQGF